jgi:hypothetical protein
VTTEKPDGSRTGSIKYGGETITVTVKNSAPDGAYFPQHALTLTRSAHFTKVDGKLIRNRDRSQPDTFRIDNLYTSTKKLPTINVTIKLKPP